MKVLKTVSSIAVAGALAASMAISASATDYKDAVAAAEKCGVQDFNVVQLQNFLEANQNYFTSAQYDDMIKDMEALSAKYVAPKAQELGYDVATLTEDQKIEIGKLWTDADKQAIIQDLKDLGTKYNVKVEITQKSKSHYDVSATIVTSGSTNSGSTDSTGSKSDTSSAAKTVKDDAVAKTGGVEASSNSSAVAFAGLALLLAGAGVVVVARKNKE